jgi:hypothetical protein
VPRLRPIRAVSCLAAIVDAPAMIERVIYLIARGGPSVEGLGVAGVAVFIADVDVGLFVCRHGTNLSGVMKNA